MTMTLEQVRDELRRPWNQTSAFAWCAQLADAIDFHLSLPQPVAQGEAVALADAERIAQHAYIAGKRGYTFTGFVDELRSAATPAIPTGQRVVPAEPTEAMEQAAADYLDFPVKAHGLWEAMLAAAPDARGM